MSKKPLNQDRFVPEVFDWIDRVSIAKTEGFQPRATHIIPVKYLKKENKLEFFCSAIDSTLKGKINSSFNVAGIQDFSTPRSVVLEDLHFLCLERSTLDLGSKRLSCDFGQACGRLLRTSDIKEVVICNDGDKSGLLTDYILEGITLSLYQNMAFQTGSRELYNYPQRLFCLGDSFSVRQKALYRGIWKGIALARVLSDAPANWATPTKFSEFAQDIGKQNGLKVKILGKDELSKLKMDCLLSVSQGSSQLPKVIVLEIDGKDNSRCMALLGKAVTFDAGGLNLKVGRDKFIEQMKYDMSAGAAVLGAALALSHKRPPIKILCMLGAVENIPGADSTKPGDIVTAMNGKTVEVVNTDAEGRLVLADLLHYAASHYNAEFMIDIATLTGAALHALGTVGSAYLTNDKEVASFMRSVAQECGEPLWELPLWPELEIEVKSKIADFTNLQKPEVMAGTIMGAMFLKEFIGGKKWVHIDMAGTSHDCKAAGYPREGASGFGVRTLTQACLNYQ